MYKNQSIDLHIESKKSLKPRLFCIISKKHFPKAVGRNKVKRWCRALWRESGFAKKENTTTTIRARPTIKISDIRDGFYAEGERFSQLG